MVRISILAGLLHITVLAGVSATPASTATTLDKVCETDHKGGSQSNSSQCLSSSHTNERAARKRKTRPIRRKRRVPTPPKTVSLPSPIPQPTPPTQPGGGNTGLGAFEQSCLDSHNKFRAIVGVGPVSWSLSAQAAAKRWANQLASTGTFEHSRGAVGRFGENLFKSSRKVYACEVAIQSFLMRGKTTMANVLGRVTSRHMDITLRLYGPKPTKLDVRLTTGLLFVSISRLATLVEKELPDSLYLLGLNDNKKIKH
ncbi:hypothetical protein BASA83_007431 [Batrachochytrium salamandrivorans]|nr:hypothetical protein BASA83_007431 [Batrachochytrium salamandrivorans]